MAKATECVLTVESALRLKNLLNQSGRPVLGLFQCKHCGRRVTPHPKGRTTAAHFEHLERNIECPYSEKSKARQLYAKYRSAKVTAKAKPKTKAKAAPHP